MRHSLSAETAALTATTRSAVTEITVPGGQGENYVLSQIDIVNLPTAETVVNSGGMVEVENDSVDYKPLELITPGVTVVTEGGGNIKKTSYKVRKPLPAGSKVRFYANPYDNQSQKFCYTIHWDDASRWSGKQTYADNDLGTAVTQVTIDENHLTWTIPAGKAGMLKELIYAVLGTLETVVNSGGLCKFTEKSKIGLNPREFYTNGNTVVDAGGAQVELQSESLAGYQAPGNATINLDFTPEDNQSQRLTGSLFWEA